MKTICYNLSSSDESHCVLVVILIFMVLSPRVRTRSEKSGISASLLPGINVMPFTRPVSHFLSLGMGLLPVQAACCNKLQVLSLVFHSESIITHTETLYHCSDMQ